VSRSRPLAESLLALERVRDAGPALLRPALAAALEREAAPAAAKAARLAAEREQGQLLPNLVRAFGRFMVRPAKSDPGCAAKTAIVEALNRLGHDDTDVYLRGIRHVQLEPVFGGKVDTAVDLRGASAFGLVALGHHGVLYELADLLADPEPPARISAARALASLGSDDAVPLLRLRTLIGDAEPRVVAECLLAILRLQPSSGLTLAARLLDDPLRAEAAAAALGESRLREALAPLREWVGRTLAPDLRRAGLLALGQLRREEADDYLVQFLEESRGPAALDALEALALGRSSAALAERVAAAVRQRRDPRLESEWRRLFPPPR
jgi:HEAT repeat protein